MNIESIESGMLVRVKTIEELRSEGYIEHRGGFIDFKPSVSFGCFEYRRPYFGSIFRVENVSSGVDVHLSSCYYNEPDIFEADELIWWHPDLLAPAEAQKEFEIEEDPTEFSEFLELFEVVP